MNGNRRTAESKLRQRAHVTLKSHQRVQSTLLIVAIFVLAGCSAPTESADLYGEPESPSPAPTSTSVCDPVDDSREEADSPPIVSDNQAPETELTQLPNSQVDSYGTELKSYTGPPRPKYTLCHPAQIVTFNSIEDLAHRKFETSFLAFDADAITDVHPKPSRDDNWTWSHLEVATGAVYSGSIYFWNDVASNVSTGVAQNARVRLQIDKTLKRQSYISAIISADNATPKEVFSGVVLDAVDDESVHQLDIVPDSVNVWTPAGGYELDVDELTSKDGSLIGCSTPDGKLTGANDCWGYVNFQIKVSDPQYSVRSESLQSMSSTADVLAGDTTTMQIFVENRSDIPLSSFRFDQNLPEGARYVLDSATTQLSLEDGTFGTRHTVDFGDVKPDRYFYVIAKESVPPHAGLSLYFDVRIDREQCKGSWLPIRSQVQQGGLAVDSQIVLNVVATC